MSPTPWLTQKSKQAWAAPVLLKSGQLYKSVTQAQSRTGPCVGNRVSGKRVLVGVGLGTGGGAVAVMMYGVTNGFGVAVTKYGVSSGAAVAVTIYGVLVGVAIKTITIVGGIGVCVGVSVGMAVTVGHGVTASVGLISNGSPTDGAVTVGNTVTGLMGDVLSNSQSSAVATTQIAASKSDSNFMRVPFCHHDEGRRARARRRRLAI